MNKQNEVNRITHTGGYIQDNLQEVILRLWILADISFNSSFLNL